MQSEHMDELLDGWRKSLSGAIVRVERALQRWRDRQEMVAVITAKMDRFTRSKWMAQDQELQSAMEDYGFWQREVVRFSAQIQAFCALEGRAK